MLAMERSLGLEELSPVERDVYYAANEVAKDSGGVQTTRLLNHPLVAGVSRPTFFRAVKSLVKQGYLSQSDQIGRGLYSVKSSPD